MNHTNAYHESDARADHQHGNKSQANVRKNALIVLGVTIIAVIGWYVEILLFFSYAQEHWHDLWFKILAITFPFLPSIAVYCALVAVAKWSRSTSSYIAALLAVLIAAAVVLAYMGDSMPKEHPKIVAYSIASILTIFVVAPIWYGAYRFSENKVTQINRNEVPTSTPDSTKTDGIRASFSRIFINDGLDRASGFWIAHLQHDAARTPEAIQPVPLAIYLRVVNQTKASLMLDSWQVEHEEPDGKWIATEWYQPGLDEFNPTALVGGPKNPCSFVGLNPKYNFRLLIDQKNLAPGDTVLGWAFLKSKTRIVANKLRFHAWDTAGREFVAPIAAGQPMTDLAMMESILLYPFEHDISKTPVDPWPISPRTAPSTDPAAQTTDANIQRLTLRELFNTDFNKYFRTSNEFVFAFGDGREARLPYSVMADFSARTKFVAFFVPHSQNALNDCHAIADNFEKTFEAVEEAVSVTARRDGEVSSTDMKDLTFSGRVYIYHEDYLDLQQMAFLERIFTSKNAAVAFRGDGYLSSRWTAKMAKESSAKPA